MAEQVIIEFVADTSKLEEAYSKVTTQINNSSELNKESVVAFQKANVDAAASFSIVSDSAKMLNDQLRNISSVISGGLLKGLVTDLKVFSDILLKSNGGAKTLSAQLTEAGRRFTELAEAGKKTTQEFRNQQQEMDRLITLVGQLRETFNGLDDETKRLLNVKAFGKAAAEGLESAAKAAKHAIDQNGELETTYIRLEGALKIVKSAIEGYETAAKVAHGIEIAFAAESATAWGVTTAGISLLVGGIISATTYFKNLADKEAEEQRIRKEDEMQIKQLYDEENAALTRQIELKRAVGLNTNPERLAQVALTLNQQVDALKQEILKTAFQGHFDEEKLKGSEEDAKKYLDDIKGYFSKYDYMTEDQKNAAYKLIDAVRDTVTKRLKIEAEGEQEIKATKAAAAKENFDAIKAQLEKELSLYTVNREKKRADMEAEGIGNKKLREFDDTTLEGQIAIQKKLSDNQIAAYKSERKIEEEKLSAEAKNLKETAHGVEVEIELTKYKAHTIAEVDKMRTKEMQDEEEKRLAMRKRKSDGEHLDSSKNDTNTPPAGPITDDTLQKLPTNQVDTFNRDERAKAKETSESRLEAMKKFNMSREQIDLEYSSFVDATGESDYNKFLDWEGKKIKSKEDLDKTAAAKKLDTEKQIAAASIQFAKQASDQIFAVVNQNRNQRYNAEISTLEKQKDFELNNNNLTQAQKLAIQRKFDKETAAIKLQQWKADQKSKEEQAIINGALAVANIMATMPWTTFGVTQGIAIAAAAASTATSVATIAAQKPPQFATGTPAGAPDTPAGMKLVGEHGPELIYTPGGERIITAPDTAAILAKYEVPALPNVSADVMMRANAQYITPVINEKSLAKEIAGEIAKQSKPLLQFDKNGFTAHLVGKGGKTTILNNKYRL